MTNDAFQNTLANDQRLIENALQQLLPPTVFDQGEVVEAMRYSLMNGGKRLRPVLALEFCRPAAVTGTPFWSRPALWNMYTLTA